MDSITSSPTPPVKLLDASSERDRAKREALVRAQVKMLPQYQIVRNPADPRLYAANKYVKDPRAFVDEAQTLVGHTMIENGVGLAAPQMGLNIRMCVVKPPDYPKAVVFFNPHLVEEECERNNDLQWDIEGCVSHPGIWGEVARMKRIVFIARTLTKPETQKYEASGLFARIIQHEIDHLNGKLFTDLGLYKRNLTLDPVGQGILFGQNAHAEEHGFEAPETD